MSPSPTQAERDAQYQRERNRFETDLTTMGAEQARARLHTFTGWRWALATNFINAHDEAAIKAAAREEGRKAKADFRDRLRTWTSVAALMISVVAIALSALALFRPTWANLPPLP